MTFSKFCNDVFKYRADKTFNPDAEHYGNCTRHSCPCDLCMLEMALREYREYIFKNDTAVYGEEL